MCVCVTVEEPRRVVLIFSKGCVCLEAVGIL